VQSIPKGRCTDHADHAIVLRTKPDAASKEENS